MTTCDAGFPIVIMVGCDVACQDNNREAERPVTVVRRRRLRTLTQPIRAPAIRRGPATSRRRAQTPHFGSAALALAAAATEGFLTPARYYEEGSTPPGTT